MVRLMWRTKSCTCQEYWNIINSYWNKTKKGFWVQYSSAVQNASFVMYISTSILISECSNVIKSLFLKQFYDSIYNIRFTAQRDFCSSNSWKLQARIPDKQTRHGIMIPSFKIVCAFIYEDNIIKEEFFIWRHIALGLKFIHIPHLIFTSRTLQTWIWTARQLLHCIVKQGIWSWKSTLITVNMI